MRKPVSALAVASLLIFLAGAASAAVVPFSGGAGVSIAGLPPIAATGTGLATINNSGGGNHIGSMVLPSSPFGTTSVVIPVTDPAAFPIQGVQATVHNGTGVFSGGDGGILEGPMAIEGVAKVCLFAACGAPPPANVSVPISVVGLGGTTTASVLVNATVIGAPWTTGQASVAGSVVTGFAHGPVSGTSSTASASGALRLVTPVFVSTNIGASAVLPTFGILDLHFGVAAVPEPGTILLLGSGIAGLLALGRSQRS